VDPGCECIAIGELGDEDAKAVPAPMPIVLAPPAPVEPGVSLGAVLFVTAVVATALYLYVKD